VILHSKSIRFNDGLVCATLDPGDALWRGRLTKKEVPMIGISIALKFGTSAATFGLRGLRAVLRQASTLVTAARNRSAVKSLAELDDHALKDIGLTRSDVIGALAEPFYRDPSEVLWLRSGERLTVRPQVRVMPRPRPPGRQGRLVPERLAAHSCA
jgi:uncharacterized protein YjiS (DUF1127 family)